MHLFRRHSMPDFVEDVSTVVPADNQVHKLYIDYKKEVRSLFVKVRFGKDAGLHQGIFDSGAQSVCIQHDISIGLPVIGQAVVNGATGATHANIVKGSFHLVFDNGELTINDAPMFAVPLPGNVSFLIGQPVIKKFNFDIAKGFNRIDVAI